METLFKIPELIALNVQVYFTKFHLEDGGDIYSRTDVSTSKTTRFEDPEDYDLLLLTLFMK
jgi:hypothetical protein